MSACADVEEYVTAATTLRDRYGVSKVSSRRTRDCLIMSAMSAFAAVEEYVTAATTLRERYGVSKVSSRRTRDCHIL